MKYRSRGDWEERLALIPHGQPFGRLCLSLNNFGCNLVAHSANCAVLLIISVYKPFTVNRMRGDNTFTRLDAQVPARGCGKVFLKTIENRELGCEKSSVESALPRPGSRTELHQILHRIVRRR